MTELLSCGEMNGIERAKRSWVKDTCGIQDAIIDADQLQPLKNSATPGNRLVARRQQRAQHFCTRECAGDQRTCMTGPEITAQCGRLRFAHGQFYNRRRVQIRRHDQRSFRRKRRSTVDGRSTPSGRTRGSGKSSRSAVAGSISPRARSLSSGLPSGGGDRTATGRPRSVTSIVSPCSTRRSNSLARCLSSLTPIDAMCYL